MENRKRKCIAAAAVLKEHAPHSFNPELVSACSDALRDMGEHLDAYEGAVRIAPDFLEELHTGVEDLLKLKDAMSNAVQDLAFNLFEAAVIITVLTLIRHNESQRILWSSLESSLAFSYPLGRVAVRPHFAKSL